MRRLGLLTLHGMGRQKPDYAAGLFTGIRRILGKSDSDKIHFESIYYQDVLGDNQESMLRKARPKVRSKLLRNFLVHWLSDATTLESRKDAANSAYTCTQREIRKALDKTFCRIERDAPVVIVAHSLGCQVISNYIWDAQRKEGCCRAPSFGIWRECEVDQNASKSDDTDDIDDFRRLKRLRTLFTTGCNIPLFVSGQSNIKAIRAPDPGKPFRWYNYYDRDDVLGWPLKPLSEEYCKLVTDIPVCSGGSFLSLTPLSHGYYWKSRCFLNPLSNHLRALLNERN